jgi:hypothetical protein
MIFAAIEALLLFKRGDAMGKHARYVVNLEKSLSAKGNAQRD